jgi:acyl-CoA thioesterase FadM
MVKIRWRDVDIQGHVNHIPILEIIAQDRIEFLDAMYDNELYDHVLVHQSIDYKTKLFYPNEVTVWHEIAAKRNTSVETRYKVLGQDGQIVAVCTCVNAFYELDTGLSCKVPF